MKTVFFFLFFLTLSANHAGAQTYGRVDIGAPLGETRQDQPFVRINDDDWAGSAIKVIPRPPEETARIDGQSDPFLGLGLGFYQLYHPQHGWGWRDHSYGYRGFSAAFPVRGGWR